MLHVERTQEERLLLCLFPFSFFFFKHFLLVNVDKEKKRLTFKAKTVREEMANEPMTKVQLSFSDI